VRTTAAFIIFAITSFHFRASIALHKIAVLRDRVLIQINAHRGMPVDFELTDLTLLLCGPATRVPAISAGAVI
jgi:hypothetical protein